jgi:phosphotransferase system IIA component
VCAEHALILRATNASEEFIHIRIDTVQLQDENFNPLIKV